MQYAAGTAKHESVVCRYSLVSVSTVLFYDLHQFAWHKHGQRKEPVTFLLCCAATHRRSLCCPSNSPSHPNAESCHHLNPQSSRVDSSHFPSISTLRSVAL
uniref:Uncharacterized protein n=1 Tax=Eutreptiella gymnastica TaxID=73025 RepID=A0A7S1N7J6_9EUGL